MKKYGSKSRSLALVTTVWLASGGALPAVALDLPWQEAGLTEAEAAAHLLDRLTFGPRPGEVDRVVETGLETWLGRQLDARDPDRVLQSHLADLSSLDLDVREYPETYPNPGMVLREAMEAGVLPEGVDIRQGDDSQARRQARRAVFDWARDKGYQSQRVLVGELLTQKLYRAR